jgi:hypothetical protein
VGSRVFADSRTRHFPSPLRSDPLTSLALLPRARFSAPCKGALHQPVEVRPEELSMHLGSYRAREAVGNHRREAPRQKASERRSSKCAGRNEAEARAGPESNVVDADPAEPRRRPTLLDDGKSTGLQKVHRGIGRGTRTRRSAQHGRSSRTKEIRRRERLRCEEEVGGARSTDEAGNDRGGKEPWFRVLSKRWTRRGLA